MKERKSTGGKKKKGWPSSARESYQQQEEKTLRQEENILGDIPPIEEETVAEERTVVEEETATKERVTEEEKATARDKTRAEERTATEKESFLPFCDSFSPYSHSWSSGAKMIAGWYINTSEKLAKEFLAFQEKSTGWAKDTSWAQLFEIQNAGARQLVEGSANMARQLWKLERE